jgi:hypothetical protein
MAGMARHGSAAAFSGFSVCQPALGAALQWLPAVGTPELDEMINGFLPGPASIQDKRAHISMDFFEYYRQTGENFKFYAIPSGSFTPLTASPASSALYDSGYSSSFNHSPVLSDQGSWTQSPAPFAPSASDARTKSRSSTSKRASTSSSRQQTIDFASHPGMRILTKDGLDVTNSASRGCKTKEQRDHAHLMRIIKACDACKRKKIRCDPSHRKRTASQASTAQVEQKPAKKPRKAEEPPTVAVLGDAPPDFFVGNAFDAPETTLSFPTLETGYSENFDEFWNDFITFDQEPVAVSIEHTTDNFLLNSFTDSQNFFSPSPGSSTTPSQVFTPSTPALSRTSPVLSDGAAEVAGEVSQHDLTVPYLNPGVAHGTNYVDFNLYSPGPDVFDEDPVLQMVDLGSQQRSPQPHRSAASHAVATPESWFNSLGGVAASSIDVPDTSTSISPYLDPGSTANVQAQFHARRSSSDKRRAYRTVHVGAASSETVNVSSVQSPVSQIAAPMLGNDASTVFAHALQLSVSPGSSPRPRRPAGTGHSPVASPTVVSSVPGGVIQTGILASATGSPLAVTSCHTSSLRATHVVSSAVLEQSHKTVRDAASASVSSYEQGCVSSSVSAQLPAGLESGAFAQPDGRYGVQHSTVVLSAVLATIFTSTLPTRRMPAGEDAKNGVTSSLRSSALFQLAVLGLVSLLCASALQAQLGTQVNLVNMLVITSLSLARLAPWCSGSSSVTLVTSRTLPSLMSSGFVNTAKLKIQAVGRSLRDLQSTVVQQVGNFVPRLASVRSLRL